MSSIADPEALMWSNQGVESGSNMGEASGSRDGTVSAEQDADFDQEI